MKILIISDFTEGGNGKILLENFQSLGHQTFKYPVYRKDKYDLILVEGNRILKMETLKKLKAEKIFCWWKDYDLETFERHSDFFNFFDKVYVQTTEPMKYFTPLLWGWIPEIFYKRKLSIQEEYFYSSDVVFVGTFHISRQHLINHLYKLSKAIKVKIWGTEEWKKYKRFWAEKPVYYDEYAKVLSASKICFNIHRWNVGISQRVFEGLGCGCLVLTDRVKGLDKYFKHGEHLVTYDSSKPNHMLEYINFYLEEKEKRNKIIEGGVREVKKHKLRKRLKRILRDYEKT